MVQLLMPSAAQAHSAMPPPPAAMPAGDDIQLLLQQLSQMQPADGLDTLDFSSLADALGLYTDSSLQVTGCAAPSDADFAQYSLWTQLHADPNEDRDLDLGKVPTVSVSAPAATSVPALVGPRDQLSTESTAPGFSVASPSAADDSASHVPSASGPPTPTADADAIGFDGPGMAMAPMAAQALAAFPNAPAPDTAGRSIFGVPLAGYSGSHGFSTHSGTLAPAAPAPAFVSEASSMPMDLAMASLDVSLGPLRLLLGTAPAVAVPPPAPMESFSRETSASSWAPLQVSEAADGVLDFGAPAAAAAADSAATVAVFTPGSAHEPAAQTATGSGRRRGRGRARKRRGERRYVCSFDGCDKAYLKSSHLKCHERAHTGERPFACDEPGCEWTFGRADELTRHKRKHTGERPYVCSDCHSAFTRSDHLAAHIQTHGRHSHSKRRGPKTASIDADADMDDMDDDDSSSSGSSISSSDAAGADAASPTNARSSSRGSSSRKRARR